jgi:hypothetical protein
MAEIVFEPVLTQNGELSPKPIFTSLSSAATQLQILLSTNLHSVLQDFIF